MKGAREIPLYRATYNLLMGVDAIQNHMTKDRKHTIGTRMISLVLDMINHLRFAVDFPEDRETRLLMFLGCFDQVATLLKMSEEKRYITPSDYANLIKPLANVERQGTGWLKQVRTNSPESVCQNDILSEH